MVGKTDYSSEAEVVKAWNAGKVFRICTATSHEPGKRITRKGALKRKLQFVIIRYNHWTQRAIIVVNGQR